MDMKVNLTPTPEADHLHRIENVVADAVTAADRMEQAALRMNAAASRMADAAGTMLMAARR